MYDPESDTWSRLAPMPTPRQHINAAVVDGKLYVIGGMERGTLPSGSNDWQSHVVISNKNEMYDPATDTWLELSPLPTPRHSPNTYMVVHNGQIYVIGGMGDEESIWTALKTVEIYDPETDTWQQKADFPADEFLGSFVIDNRIFIVGIVEREAQLMVYDSGHDTWDILGNSDVDKWQAGITTLDDKVYFIGGNNAGYTPYADVFEGVLMSQSVQVTYIANCGFLVEVGDKKVLIDALFTESWGQYDVPSQIVRTQIKNGEFPFENVDLMVITHKDDDHFDASEVRGFLSNHPACLLIGPSTVTNRLRSFDEQIIELEPAYMKQETVIVNDISVTGYRLQHYGVVPGTPNIGYLISVNGKQIFHNGDGGSHAEYEMFQINETPPDVALLNYNDYWRLPQDRQMTMRFIQPKHVVLHHIPTNERLAVAQESQSIEDTDFPEIIVPQTSLESCLFDDFNTETHIHMHNLKPREFFLNQNYPNPFNPATVIGYTVTDYSEVELTIYNALGHKVRELVKSNQATGYYQIVWDGHNDTGQRASSGAYLMQLSIRGNSGIRKESRKMMLIH